MRKPKINAGAGRYLDEIALAKAAPFHALSVNEARKLFVQKQARLNLPPTKKCQTQDLMIAGSVPIRLYTPSATKAAPVLVYFHGGGWTLGNLDTVDALCHDLCHQSQWAVLSVDYRLAPEHPYPAALEDGRQVLNAIVSGSFGDQINDTCIAIAGDSSGGNIAAVLALEWCEKLAAQVLIYPVTDRTKKHGSMVEFATGLNLDDTTMNWFWNNYVPDPALAGDWHVSPLYAEPNCPLPPALVIVAGYDPLVDEGLAYADHLCGLGCETELLAFPDQIHGFATQSSLSSSPYLLRDAVAGFLRRRRLKELG